RARRGRLGDSEFALRRDDFRADRVERGAAAGEVGAAVPAHLAGDRVQPCGERVRPGPAQPREALAEAAYRVGAVDVDLQRRVWLRCARSGAGAARTAGARSAKRPSATVVNVLNGLVLHAVRNTYSSNERSMRRARLPSAPDGASR